MSSPSELDGSVILLYSLRVAASTTSRSLPLKSDTKTYLPSRVIFRRLALPVDGIVWSTFLVATSMMEMVLSCALATQSSSPSGDRSKPSDPRPTGMLVIFQSGPPRPPGGGPPLPRPSGAPGAPGPTRPPGPRPGPGPGPGATPCSIMLTVAELTLE